MSSETVTLQEERSEENSRHASTIDASQGGKI
jgi:hypothetical protein